MDAATHDDALSRRILDEAMAMAAAQGWRRTGLVAVAAAADVPLGEMYRRFPSRASLLAGVSRRADAAVLSDGPPPGDGAAFDESPRDRLFDVLMRRFDALLPHRPGLVAVADALPREPLTALAFSRQLARSMAWMLRAAGIDPDGRGGPALVAGLCGVYARTARVFLTDDSADLARTMAALDSELRRAEEWANTLCRCRARVAPRSPAPPPPEPPPSPAAASSPAAV